MPGAVLADREPRIVGQPQRARAVRATSGAQKLGVLVAALLAVGLIGWAGRKFVSLRGPANPA